MDNSRQGVYQEEAANGPSGNRVQHQRHEPERLVNRFQPNHKFLDQLLNKSPMCLVNEIGRYHNIKPDYVLLETTGPNHSKRFSVALHLGTYEKFIGEGSSVKNAQRNAAVSALQNTQFSFPRAQYGSNRYSAANSWNGGPVTQTPASELNTVLMKRGVQPKYELTAEKICLEDATGTSNEQHFSSNQIQQQQHSKPALLPSPLPIRHAKVHQPLSKVQVRPHSHMAIPVMPHSYSPNGYMIVPPAPHALLPLPHYHPMFPTLPYNLHLRPDPHRHHPQSGYPPPFNASHYSPYHSNIDYGFNMAPFSYVNVNRWNMFPQSPLLHTPVQSKQVNTTTNFEAKVEFDGHQFSGQGRTVQAARHSAANEALKFVKNQQQPGKAQNGGAHQARSTSQTSSSSENDDQPSPISLVYEFASRNRLQVYFEVIRETGQIHMPAFLMRCSLFAEDSKQPFMVADGEGRSKRDAKKKAASVMMTVIKEQQVSDENNLALNFARVLSRQTKNASEKLLGNTVEQQQNNNAETMLQGTDSTGASTVSCRFVTLLYQLTRNMLIPHPVYSSSSVAEADELVANFKAALGDCCQEDADSKASSVKLYKAECTLTFEQRLPQHLTCLVKATGYGSSARAAKSISTYICLLKIGVALPPIDSETSSVMKSLQFSLTHNLNVPEPTSATESAEDVPNLPAELTGDSVIASIEQNLQFVIHILSKLYLFTLKDGSTKSMDRIFAKLESTLTAFYAHKYAEVSNAEVATKCNLLQNLISTLDGTKYWSHLELVSNLVSLGVESSQLPTEKPLLYFKPHLFVSEGKTPPALSSHYVSIISGHCNVYLSSTFNFALVKKNFVNFGIGSNEENAREMASYWILKHLAYQARKQMIENEYDEMAENADQITATAATSAAKSPTGPKAAALRSKSKSSTSSYGQIISKQCITQLFRASSELNIRKPVFASEPCSANSVANNPDKTPLAPNLVRVTCTLSLIQEVPEQLTTQIVTTSIAPSQRLGRTICAYTALHKFGFLSSMNLADLSKLEHFETYLRLSQCNNSGPSRCNDEVQFPPVQLTSEQSQETKGRLEANMDEIGRNLDFVVRLLQEYYRSFLKNHKMSCPSPLIARLERELFEYHNHQQQIMDESGTFDRCSANIEKSIGELMRRFDGTQFWDHLQLLAAIASLLTANLDQPLTPAVLQFQCQINKCAELIKTNSSSSSPSQQQQSSATSVSVAIVSLESPLPCSQTRSLTKKSFLSFALGQSEEMARERAAYKALRHLAINLWK